MARFKIAYSMSHTGVSCIIKYKIYCFMVFAIIIGVQWLSGRMLDLRSRGRWFEHPPKALRCVLEQYTSFAAEY